jgi:fructokinase
MFGSFYAINPVIRPQMQAFLEYAHEKGAILYYDVNYRASHLNDLVKVTANILENFELADIIKGSSEDFEIMYNKKDADSVYRAQIDFYCKNFVYTQGANPIEFRAKGGLSKQYPVAATKTVSTIGAGDNFNAGFVYGLLKYGVTRNMLDEGVDESIWNNVINEAQQFAANVCGSINNSVDIDFGDKKKAEYQAALESME